MDKMTEKNLKSWLWQRHHAGFLNSNELSYLLTCINNLTDPDRLHQHKRPKRKFLDFLKTMKNYGRANDDR